MTRFFQSEELTLLFGDPFMERYEHVFDRILRRATRSHHRSWRCGCYGVLQDAGRWKIICCDQHALLLRREPAPVHR